VSKSPTIGPKVAHPRWFEFCRSLCALVMRMCRCSVTGREHVPDEGPFILACNHRSYIDPPATGHITRRPLSFLARHSLFTIPILGRLIRTVNAFPVRPGTADLGALRTGLKILRAGRGLVIFPEGTRSPALELLQPQLGVSILALRSEAPVLPVGMTGMERVMPRKFPIILPRKCAISVGAPITFDDLYGKKKWEREELEHVACTIMEGIAGQIGKTFEWKPEDAVKGDPANP